MGTKLVTQKKTVVEGAEKRYRTLIEERDKLNLEANVVKEERDILNKQKSDSLDEMSKLKQERNALIDKLREHKKKRDAYHKKAKELLAIKRDKRRDIIKSIPEEYNDLSMELKSLELMQQTTPMSIEKENKIIGKIRDIRLKNKRLENILKEQEQLGVEISGIDSSVDELFKKGNEEHEEVIKLSNSAQDFHEKMKSILFEVSHLINKAKKKHDEYMKIKERANEMHMKAVEMRANVVALKREAWLRKELEKKEVARRKELIEKKFTDEKSLESAVEKSLEKLMKKGKVTL